MVRPAPDGGPDYRQRPCDGYMGRTIKRDGRWYLDLEHRAVMERHLGRRLRSDEHVHHENENRTEEHPDLVRRAVAIEQNAKTRTVIGLGRTWRWGDLFTDLESLTPKQMSLPMCGVEMACDCFDGEAA